MNSIILLNNKLYYSKINTSLLICPVLYDISYKLNVYSKFNFCSSIRENITNICTKNSCWKYEKEWRLFIPYLDNYLYPGLKLFPIFPKKIYYGPNCKTEIKTQDISFSNMEFDYFNNEIIEKK